MQIDHVKAERNVLTEVQNSFVVKLYYSFQDDDYLYLIMEYLPGGDVMVCTRTHAGLCRVVHVCTWTAAVVAPHCGPNNNNINNTVFV